MYHRRGPEQGNGLASGTVTVNPLASPYLSFFPTPNGPISGDAGTYSLVTQNVTTESFATARGDHRFSDKDSLHMTWLFDSGQTSGPDVFGNLLLGTFAQRQTASIEESHVFTSSAVNFVRVGLNRVTAEQVQALSAINPLAADPSYGFLPGRDAGQISIAGFTTYPGGPGAEGDYLFHYTSYQADDNFALTKGSHSIRAGVALERIQANTVGAGNNNGVVSFGSLQSFLTDQPSSFQATLPGTSLPESLRQYIVGTYLQDDWRAGRNLSLNLGLRYEMATVPTEQHDRLGTLVPGSQQLKIGSPYFQNPTLRNFSPRVGLAWNPLSDRRTTIRAAFGQYDAHVEEPGEERSFQRRPNRRVRPASGEGGFDGKAFRGPNVLRSPTKHPSSRQDSCLLRRFRFDAPRNCIRFQQVLSTLELDLPDQAALSGTVRPGKNR